MTKSNSLIERIEEIKQLLKKGQRNRALEKLDEIKSFLQEIEKNR